MGIVHQTDVVFHLAAIARPSSVPDNRYVAVNANGTRNLLDACRHSEISKIVMMSSVAAQGPRYNEPFDEESEFRPSDAYGRSKLAQERAARTYIDQYQMPIVILRPPTVFGPRDLEFLKFIRMVKARFFPIRCAIRCINYLYVDNLVDACLLVMARAPSGEVYLIDNREPCSLNRILTLIATSLNVRMVPLYLPNSVMTFAGYLLESTAKPFRFQPPFTHETTRWMTRNIWPCDISKLTNLGYVPSISIGEGVKQTVDYSKSVRLV